MADRVPQQIMKDAYDEYITESYYNGTMEFFGLMVHGDVRKILKFKDVLKIETQGKQYKSKIVALSALRNSDKLQQTLQESQWFDQIIKDCITDFKEKK